MVEPLEEPAAALVWSKTRRTPRRQAPSVERIVATAIAIADAEGLPALSMRRVAADLGSGTASLYRYVAGRDELVDLMIDTVHGEDPLPAPTGDWRADLSHVARQLRTVLLRHPWLGSELPGRPTLGPNSLRRMEACLAAASALTPDISRAVDAVEAVLAYTLGAVGTELAELRAQQRSGLTEDQWRASVAPYIREVVDSGAYPQFARRVIEAEDADPEQRFGFGLSCMLDGVAARVG
ncbi:TetR/AcrR family transcriptional regulator C-terminal domain-containing protein [Streptomyces sp. NPDC006430]|uniref:TetR/AcrR family transcriptional regulator C-terminal domain-containing protein n=1 Tax=Streptomyces sp. NPDC006430 TaxID=3154299 RepID=UPI0033BCF2E9